jgi:hypothetical protein
MEFYFIIKFQKNPSRFSIILLINICLKKNRITIIVQMCEIVKIQIHFQSNYLIFY